MKNNIALITVVYQNYEVIKDLFSSLLKQNNNNYHLIISDLSDNKEKIVTDSLPVTIINSKNLGYAHGVNIALKTAIDHNFSLFSILNNDTYVSNNFIETVGLSLRKYPSTIIGGKIYYAPGFEYHKSRYNKRDLGKVIWYAGGIIDWDNVYIKHKGVDEIDQEKFNILLETDFITGCLINFDKKVIDKVGFLDESFFLYYEDADFCERAKRKNIKLYYDPSITIWHKNAQSTGGSGSSIHKIYQEKNRVKFALKYAPLNSKLHIIKNYFQTRLFST